MSRGAEGLLSNELGAFTGALLVTPVAAWVERRPSGPPSLATMMPAFWLLVPGAVGLIGVAHFVGSGPTAAPGAFVEAFVTFVLIGLGVFLGNAVVLGMRARRAALRPTESAPRSRQTRRPSGPRARPHRPGVKAGRPRART